MNHLFRSVLSYFRGCTIRTYLVVLPDHARIRNQLKLEDMRNELGIMDLRSRELSIEQKRVEHMLTDLTRCIRGIEFDLKLIADLEKQRESKAKGSTHSKSSDKKSPKVGDFSD